MTPWVAWSRARSVGRQSTYTYTAGSRLATMIRGGAQWRLAYDRCGRLSSVADPDGNATRIGYDESGRIVTMTRPDGEVRQLRWGPQGHPVEVAVAGTTTRYDLDPKGRVTALYRGDQLLRGVTYDQVGLPVAVTDGLAQVTTIDYDDRGHRVRITGPDGASWETQRGLLGRSLGLIDPVGQRVSLQRDAAGRIVGRGTADGSLSTALSPDGNS